MTVKDLINSDGLTDDYGTYLSFAKSIDAIAKYIKRCRKTRVEGFKKLKCQKNTAKKS